MHRTIEYICAHSFVGISILLNISVAHIIAWYLRLSALPNLNCSINRGSYHTAVLWMITYTRHLKSENKLSITWRLYSEVPELLAFSLRAQQRWNMERRADPYFWTGFGVYNERRGLVIKTFRWSVFHMHQRKGTLPPRHELGIWILQMHQPNPRSKYSHLQNHQWCAHQYL